jgi:hypothetical protein
VVIASGKTQGSEHELREKFGDDLYQDRTHLRAEMEEGALLNFA